MRNPPLSDYLDPNSPGLYGQVEALVDAFLEELPGRPVDHFHQSARALLMGLFIDALKPDSPEM